MIKPRMFQPNPKLYLWLRIALHVICLWILISLFYRAFTNQLGGDPVKALIHATGLDALRLLLLSLLVAPMARWLRQSRLTSLRRPLGLYSFFFAVAHFGSYLAFDLQFDWALIGEELTSRPYIIVGLLALVILLILAVTSIPKIVRRLARRWKPLHRLVFVAAFLGCLHFLWSVKSAIGEPLIYLIFAVALTATRLPEWRRLARQKRQRQAKRPPPQTHTEEDSTAGAVKPPSGTALSRPK